ncbi:helix-turn-helix domain-containing protein [Planomonospora sp. ID67723]|uniref:PucR family transcriptional regulator n=1 Tax=Planomonospora sp. ID67723 TaxID=2738134 RepID=UPI0018C388B5|nr:helix-turn-helix domain-containing protein [Planomonospora sp. ID67723]MBG0832460.1 helix-turn-helix domain-containing protein [Planomonospora sp. ID67723]
MAHPDFAALSRRLLGQVDPLAERLAQRIRTAEAELAVVPPEDLTAVCALHLRGIYTYLAGEGPMELETVRANARRRALQGVPLAALLHSYRVGTLFIWESYVATAGRRAQSVLLESVSELWLGLEDYSEAVRTTYHEVEAERELRVRRDRDLLFDALLGTDHARIRESADTLGLPQQGRFHVLAAESAAEPRLPVQAVWRELPGERLAVLSLDASRPAEGPRSPGGLLTDPPPGRFGISPPYTQISQTASALRLARLALASVPPGTDGVSRYGDRPVATLVASSPETADDLARRVLGAVLSLPAEDRGTLLGTAHAWFASGGSTARTAESLFCHRNTVRYRLARIESLTGRRFDDPRQAAELFTALETLRVLP